MLELLSILERVGFCLTLERNSDGSRLAVMPADSGHDETIEDAIISAFKELLAMPPLSKDDA